MLVGTVFDAGVWYFVKNVQIFDDEVKPVGTAMQPEEQIYGSRVNLDHKEKEDGCEMQNNILNHLHQQSNQHNDKTNNTSDESKKH